ncbi:hypothetical protein VTN77DRAFT_477 [Rasamsonia byssochlamydoides]|uniref:uncharacterized protein n=1 Tax=Rasamsonia byssochlamydoides TaxID=89139 RepID=UPI003742C4AB
MSLTLKLSSLLIRTLSKPIANQIKAQAREHPRFRRMCVSFAQALHRVDMRLRLGLLRDTEAIERQAAKEAAEAEAKKHKPQVPTVKTEAETKAEEAAAEKAKEKAIESAKQKPLPRIRPLSESKAIDTGANFISEAFLFLVAGGLIVFESWRSRRKETSHREDVQDRLNELEQSEKAARRALAALEKELLELKAQSGKHSVKDMQRVLPREVWEDEQKEEEEEKAQQGWASRIWALFSSQKGDEATQPGDAAATAPQDVQEPKSAPQPIVPAAKGSTKAGSSSKDS